MTIQRKIRGGYIGLAVLIVALAAMGFGLLAWLNSWKTDYSDTVSQVECANQLALAESSMLNYALLPLFDSFGTNEETYSTQLKTFNTMAADALTRALSTEEEVEDRGTLQSIQNLHEGYLGIINDTVEVARNTPARAYETVTSTVLPLSQQIASLAQSYKDDQLEEQATLLESLDGMSSIMWIGMSGLAFVAIVAAIAIAILLARSIVKQLRRAVADLGSSASELLAVSAQVAAGAAQTSVSATETTATVEEVKQTALLAHEKATEVAEGSKHLAVLAEAGRSTVEETISGFERIATQMGVMAETINRLGEQTQAVGDIITTVNDLAEQSNLLSVNASIEAAKAGDQGKGFTVVAQEVKSLAEQSKQAVAQVRTILGEIQKASTLAVQAAEQGQQTVEAGRRQSLESGDSVQVITDTRQRRRAVGRADLGLEPAAACRHGADQPGHREHQPGRTAVGDGHAAGRAGGPAAPGPRAETAAPDRLRSHSVAAERLVFQLGGRPHVGGLHPIQLGVGLAEADARRLAAALLGLFHGGLGDGLPAVQTPLRTLWVGFERQHRVQNHLEVPLETHALFGVGDDVELLVLDALLEPFRQDRSDPCPTGRWCSRVLMAFSSIRYPVLLQMLGARLAGVVDVAVDACRAEHRDSDAVLARARGCSSP